MTKQFKDVRRQMEEDEDLATLMRGLRGQNLNDEQFASGQLHPGGIPNSARISRGAGTLFGRGASNQAAGCVDTVD